MDGTSRIEFTPKPRGAGANPVDQTRAPTGSDAVDGFKLSRDAQLDASHKPVISIVIPFHNARETLGEQLDALEAEAAPWPWELVLVDDASSDGSIAVAEGYRNRLPLRIVRLSANRGAAAARNAGVAASCAEVVGFLDADDVIAPGWIQAAMCAARRWPAAASRFDVEALNSPDVRAERAGGQQTGLRPYEYPPFLPHCGGCGLVVRREVHERIGGFDPSLRCLEDTDYVWRLQLAGYALGFADDAVVRIRYRQNGGESARQAFRYGYSNVILYTRYRAKGMPPIPWRKGLTRTMRILTPRHLGGLGDISRRRRWLRTTSWQVGRIVASVRLRVWAL